MTRTVARRPEVDVAAAALAANPNWVMRIRGLVAAGHSLDYIVEKGRYEGTWTKADVLRVCRATNTPIPPSRPGPASSSTAPPTSGEAFPLTARQMAVLHHLVRAATNAEIAQATHIREATVKSDVRTIIQRSGKRDRIGLVVAVWSGELVPVQVET